MKLQVAAVMIVGLFIASNATAQDELGKRKTWEAPTAEQVKGSIDTWLADLKVGELDRLKVDTLWQAGDEAITSDTLLDRVALTISLVDADARELFDYCSNPRTEPAARDFEFLNKDTTADFVKDNLRLYYGRWLAQHDLYDEALERLQSLDATKIVEPATLLFYLGVTHHRLLNKDQCLPTLARLLENDQEIPQRYLKVAELMVADIQPLKTDSLDEIARLMADIRRRQALYRSGTKVRKQEDDVLAKLEKLIEELEKQQGGGGGAGAGGGKPGSQPSSPMQDSQPGGGTGPGNIDPKNLARNSDWGELPPDQRQAVLQDLSKDLPAHFREVIEEYFKKLAKDDPR